MVTSNRGPVFAVLLVVGGALLSGSEAETANRVGSSGQPGNKGPANRPVPKDQTTQTTFNFFDGDLLEAVGRDVQGNFVMSPASVKTLLGLIMEAAEGSTLEEIRGLLRLPSDAAHARELMSSLQAVLQNMNNGLVDVDSDTSAFLAKDLVINATYKRAIKDVYRAEVVDVDFKSPGNAANTINSWVRSHTRGKIPSLIDPASVDPETMAVLVNAVYFDGQWRNAFLLKDTREDCFYSEPRLACDKVQIMNKKEHLGYKFDKDFNSHIVQVPYQDERFSMVLVVPVAKDGARRIARDIRRLTFPALVEGLKSTEVLLQLPRFSIEYESELKLTLTKMGLNSVFSDGAKLPFMINNKQGRISAVIHKAKIDVNEKGTKAAAASGATVVPLMSGIEALRVTADRPFYYYIYEAESQGVLFSGRVSALEGAAGNGESAPVDGGASALSAGGYQKPSYSAAASGGPHYSSSGQPSYNPASNEPYYIESTKSPQPHVSDVQYPNDNEESRRPEESYGREQSPSMHYLETYKRNNQSPKLPFSTNNKNN